MTIYDYVIFHKGCFDGFSSFIILQNTRYISKNAIIYPDVPSAKTPPPNVSGKNVIIMDVAYKVDILKIIIDEAKSVTFIDHHITIHDDVTELKKMSHGKNVIVIYNEKESGASLTWKYFHKKKPMPLFVRYIKDNDIGEWKLKFTHYFLAGLETKYGTSLDSSTVQKWNGLFDTHKVKKLIKRGKIYWEYIDHLVEVNSKRYSLEQFPSEKIYEQFSDYFKKPAQYRVAVICGSGCPNITRLGTKMLETIDCDFVMSWSLNLDRKEYVLAFRSKEVDVGKIAGMFGGGGHTLAAACSFPANKYNIQELFLPQSLPRQNLARK